MIIKTYEPKYKDEITRLILHIQNEEAQLCLPYSEQPDLIDIEGYFLNDGGNFWVAFSEEGLLLGTIALKKAGEGGILKKFFVKRDFRGKNVGRALYEKLAGFCHAEHLRWLLLDTPSVAKRSHAFYQKAGFVQIDQAELPIPYEYPDRDSLLFLKRME